MVYIDESSKEDLAGKKNDDVIFKALSDKIAP